MDKIYQGEKDLKELELALGDVMITSLYSQYLTLWLGSSLSTLQAREIDKAPTPK